MIRAERRNEAIASRRLPVRSARRNGKSLELSVIPWYVLPMGVEKVAVSFPPDLLAHVRADADAHGESLSGWLADAASRKLRHAAAVAALEGFEAEHGEITEEELAEVQAQWQV